MDSQDIEFGKKRLPGILAASLTDPVDVNWVSGIVDFGNKQGLDMRSIYEQKRSNASLRGVIAPPYDVIDTINKQKQPIIDPIDQLFD